MVILNFGGASDAQNGGSTTTTMVGTTTHRPIHLIFHASLMILMFLVLLMFLMLLTLITCAYFVSYIA